MRGPLIKGVTVILRPPRPEDLVAFSAWFADPAVTRYLNTQFPLSPKQLEDWREMVFESDSAVVWSLATPNSEQVVGFTRIYPIDWINRRADTATVIGEKKFWGKGIAAESMQLRTQYAFQTLNLNKLKAGAYVGNEGSYRALSKAGYREVGRHRQEMFRAGKWHDMIAMEILREDWEKANLSTF